MTYQDIRNLNMAEKHSWEYQHMKYMDYGSFAACISSDNRAFLVDSDIAEKISKHRWCVDTGGYMCSRVQGQKIRLHDFVMAQEYDEKPAGNYVDHINHDKFDNRRTNLRFVTPSESARNMPLRSNNTTGYMGVSRTKEGRYRAYITINKRQQTLGHYDTKEEAAAAREEAERRLGFNARPKDIASVICAMEAKR